MKQIYNVLMVFFLTSITGCIFSIPSSKITEGVLPESLVSKVKSEKLYSILCAKKDTLIELQTDDDEPSSAGVQCTDDTLLLVVFNSYGIRTNTLNLKVNGEYLYEVTYLGKRLERPEMLLNAVLTTLSSCCSTDLPSNRKN